MGGVAARRLRAVQQPNRTQHLDGFQSYIAKAGWMARKLRPTSGAVPRLRPVGALGAEEARANTARCRSCNAEIVALLGHGGPLLRCPATQPATATSAVPRAAALGSRRGIPCGTALGAYPIGATAPVAVRLARQGCRSSVTQPCSACPIAAHLVTPRDRLASRDASI